MFDHPENYFTPFKNNDSFTPEYFEYGPYYDNVMGVDLPKQICRPPKNERKFKRDPTEYNMFIGNTISNLKKEYPNTSSTDIFRLAVESWKYKN